jgi:hypothetical protein
MKIIFLLYLTLFQNCEAKPKIGKLTELTVLSVKNQAQVYKSKLSASVHFDRYGYGLLMRNFSQGLYRV